MSTGSTAAPDAHRQSWFRRLGVPILVSVLIGAVGGGAFYYFIELRNSTGRRTNPAVARRVARTHTLVAIGGVDDEAPAFALVGRTDAGPVLLAISPSLVVEVPGLGPRTLALALRDAGPGAAAVSVANTLRITVPSSIAAATTTVASTANEVGGIDVSVPRTLRSSSGGLVRTEFGAGPVHLSGADFVRYMTGLYVDESEADRDERERAGWRGLLAAIARSTRGDPLRGWTADAAKSDVMRLLRDAAAAPAGPRLPVTTIGLAGERLVRIDEKKLSDLRQSLADWSNGAETIDGRRVRLIVAADGPIGALVGRILVNAGYVVELSGKAAKPSGTTRIAVSPAISDAESTGKDLEGLLGMGAVRISTDPDTAADIMLVIGMDWAEANGFPQR